VLRLAPKVTVPACISRPPGTRASGARDLGGRASRSTSTFTSTRKEPHGHRPPSTPHATLRRPLAAILAVGVTLTAGEPDNSASVTKIYDYWHGHYGIQLISNLLLIPLACSSSSSSSPSSAGRCAQVRPARRRIRRSRSAAASSPRPASPLPARSARQLRQPLIMDSARRRTTLAQLQSYDWVPWMVGFAVLLLASGVGGLRTNALPKPIAIAGDRARRRVPHAGWFLRAVRRSGLVARNEHRALSAQPQVDAARTCTAAADRLTAPGDRLLRTGPGTGPLRLRALTIGYDRRRRSAGRDTSSVSEGSAW